MSAMLKTGKLIRLVCTGARNQLTQPSVEGPNANSHTAGFGAESSRGQEHSLTHQWNHFGHFQNWPLFQLQNALPVTVIADDNHDNPGHQQLVPESLSSPEAATFQTALNITNVTRTDINNLLESLQNSASPISIENSVNLLKLCGLALQGDVPDANARTDFVNSIWAQMEEKLKLTMTIDHYNALLNVYMQNEHPFSPEHVQSRLKHHNIKPNKETLKIFLKRFTQQSADEIAQVCI